MRVRSGGPDVEAEVRQRFVRVVGLPPEPDDDTPTQPTPAFTPPDVDAGAALRAFDPRRRGVRALALVAAAVVVIAGVLAWRARPRVEPVPPRVEAPVTGPVAATNPGQILVAVSGRVVHPGLVRVPPGARVADVIEAAGGVLPGTDLSYVNLARKVNDGELIVIGASAPPEPGGAVGGTAGPVNLNTATLAQLDALPGVGPVLAQRIIDYRTAHGGFRSVGELRQVDGVGDARYAQLKDLVTV